jgi:alcohol dehydrogenase
MQPWGDSFEAIGGWRFGNTMDGCQAEYILVPHAQANLARIPDDLTDADVVLCCDRMRRLMSVVRSNEVPVFAN